MLCGVRPLVHLKINVGENFTFLWERAFLGEFDRFVRLFFRLHIDVLDPAHAPATGTPEAGGMTSRELLGVIRGIAGLHVVSADVVEVSPPFDHAEITGIAAAHVVYELLSVMAPTHGGE